MFKKLILILTTIGLCYAAVWSSSAADGVNLSFNQLDDKVDKLNEKSEDIWKDDIKPLIEQISEEINKKNTLLKQIESLEKEKSKVEKEVIFYLEQEKNLLGNYDSLIGIDEDKK